MSEVIGYTVSARDGTKRSFLATDPQSGYPYMSSTGIHRMFYDKDTAEACLFRDSDYISSDGILEVVEVSVKMVSTLNSIDPKKVARDAALAKLTDEDKKALGI